MSLKQFTRAEVLNNDNKKITRFIIHDKVYDVTPFLNEHPGGEEVLLDHANKDASEDFDDVGHSSDAFQIMDKYLVGEIVQADRKNTKPRKGWVAGSNEPNEKYVKGPGIPGFVFVGGIIAILLAILYFQ